MMTEPAPPAHVGARLRAIRKRQGLSLEQLVARSGLDKSFLSRLERDLTSPSVASLVKVCTALGIRPGELFDPPVTHLVRRAEAHRVNFGGLGVQEYLLSQGLDGELMVLRSVIAPAGSGGPELYTLEAQVSFVTVLSGQLELIIEEAHYFLEAGDSMTLASHTPHNWRNPSGTETVVLWVTTPHP